ncbi:DNA methyltransferase [Novosphingobium sp. ST904]|uniref:DNA methyltransferase n=1 Tax=Novosphingobium sp. ST904 TaxID=1684385 RepID=UPI0006CDC9E7|nr:DNA methyltransferase [Novosphingobium sp. ST904]KPH67530.1 hypothetical protein ADT71_02180 [Novosphingobium sp. ST904]TCM30030.1 site-specific DNA-methyltransferase (adenine-specific) [Novosphingobium sp. ST904]
MSARVILGDCTPVLRQLFLAGMQVDAVCTDPPYHLASIVARLGQPDSAPIQSGTTGVYARSSQGFMGQQWDGGDVAFRPETWRRVFDVMKPGAYLVAFAATKGYHRMACAIEDAGFEIRDMLSWLYGSGFPKSHNLDGEHEGKGTALKPAVEPIVFAQKPISEGSVAANTARWGVGAINIDACRIYTDDELKAGAGKLWSHYRTKRFAPGAAVNATGEWKGAENFEGISKPGRWPANLLHDGSEEVLDAFAAYGERGALAPVGERAGDKCRNVFGAFKGNGDNGASFRGDSGTAARFFYSSKAAQGERIFECRECGAHTIGKPTCGHADLRTHPTVKPPSLIEWLVKLVCPAGGLVLDPFAGTGTTAAAARAAGMQSLSIEADENHVRDIAVRLGLDLSQITTAEVAALPVDNGSQMDMFA